jgi:hypothetical protein
MRISERSFLLSPKQFFISSIATVISFALFKKKISKHFEVLNDKNPKFNKLYYRTWVIVHSAITFSITTTVQKIFVWRDASIAERAETERRQNDPSNTENNSSEKGLSQDDVERIIIRPGIIDPLKSLLVNSVLTERNKDEIEKALQILSLGRLDSLEEGDRAVLHSVLNELEAREPSIIRAILSGDLDIDPTTQRSTPCRPEAHQSPESVFAQVGEIDEVESGVFTATIETQGQTLYFGVEFRDQSKKQSVVTQSHSAWETYKSCMSSWTALSFRDSRNVKKSKAWLLKAFIDGKIEEDKLPAGLRDTDGLKTLQQKGNFNNPSALIAISDGLAGFSPEDQDYVAYISPQPILGRMCPPTDSEHKSKIKEALDWQEKVLMCVGGRISDDGNISHKGISLHPFEMGFSDKKIKHSSLLLHSFASQVVKEKFEQIQELYPKGFFSDSGETEFLFVPPFGEMARRINCLAISGFLDVQTIKQRNWEKIEPRPKELEDDKRPKYEITYKIHISSLLRLKDTPLLHIDDALRPAHRIKKPVVVMIGKYIINDRVV